ncbi:MAG: Dps family protein [Bacteroidota bacterium]
MKKDVYINNEELEKKLNELLSDYQMYYQNLRAFHWLIKGQQFHQLHEKFEEYYDEAADDIDEVAERILMIGGKPLHSFEDYMKNSSIKAEKDLEKASEIIPKVISNLESLLGSFREIVEVAGESDDEGTVALMGDFISAAEKKLWMLNSMQA